MNIKIIKGDLELNYKRFAFPGGEVGIKLDTENLITTYPTKITQNSIDSGKISPKANDYYNKIQKLKEEM